MSTLAEIKEAAAALPLTERFVLQSYLADLDEQRSVEYVGFVSENMRQMDAGKKISLEDFEALHEQMKRLGL